jgi:hypothetical protein
MGGSGWSCKKCRQQKTPQSNLLSGLLFVATRDSVFDLHAQSLLEINFYFRLMGAGMGTGLYLAAALAP